MPSTVTCHGVPSGQSLTAKLFADGSDTEIASGDFTPATNRKGSGTFAANVIGLHKIELRTAGGILFWYGWAILATTGAIEASDTRDEALYSAATAGSASSAAADAATIKSRIPATLFAGITSIGDWLRRMVRGDTGTAGMIAAQAEINAGGTSTWDGTTGNLQDIAAAGGGGGGSDPLENEVPGAYVAGTAGNVLGNLQSNLVTALSGITITIVSPFSDDGETLTIVQGDDHFHADGRALTVTLAGSLPDFTGGTTVMRMSRTTKTATTGVTITTTIETTGEIVTATGATRVMRFEPVSANTSQLSGGIGTWEVETTLSNGHVLTLPVAKELIVKPQLG